MSWGLPLLLPKRMKKRGAFFGLYAFLAMSDGLFCSQLNDSNKKNFLIVFWYIACLSLSAHFLAYVTLIIYGLSFLLNGLANWPIPCQGLYFRPDVRGPTTWLIFWWLYCWRRLDILSSFSFYFQSLYTLSMKGSGSGLWGSTQKEMTFHRKAKMHLVSLVAVLYHRSFGSSKIP